MIFHSSTIHFVYCYILVGETTSTPPYLVALNPMTVIFVSQHSNLNSFIKDISLFAAVLDFNSTSCVFSVPKPSSWRGDRKQTSSGIKVIHRRISREVLFNTCFTNLFCRHYNFEPHNTFITICQQLYAWRKSPYKIKK